MEPATSPERQPDESIMQHRFRIADLINRGILPPPSFSPRNLFFYGTLSLPHILQKVLDLQTEPHLQPATVRGLVQKMWGPYPALVEAPDDACDSPTIHGKTWVVNDEKHLQRLIQYEGENYRLKNIFISVAENEDPLAGWTFIWNSYPEELQEGTFDPTQFPVN